jgi:hypothetical protein
MHHPNLLEAIQRRIGRLLNKYVLALDSWKKINNYIVRPALKDTKSDISLSGVLGAIVLAKRMQYPTIEPYVLAEPNWRNG